MRARTTAGEPAEYMITWSAVLVGMVNEKEPELPLIALPDTSYSAPSDVPDAVRKEKL